MNLPVCLDNKQEKTLLFPNINCILTGGVIEIKLTKVVLVSTFSLTVLFFSTLPVHADSIDSAISQQQQLEQQKQQAQSVLRNLTSTEDKINSQLAALNTQISKAEANLKQQNAQLALLTSQLQKTQQDLADKQTELANRQQVFAQRLKAMYEEGLYASYLELLFGANGLDDLITRVEYLTSLVNNDINLLSDIQAAKAQVAEKVSNLQTLTKQATNLKNQAQQTTVSLNNTKSQQQILLAQVKQKEVAESDEISQMEAEYQALTNKIHQLQAELIKDKTGINGRIEDWPLPGDYEISDPFGPRINPVTHKKGSHTGIDIAASTGTPIHAAGDGIVLLAGYSAPWGAYGNLVLIDHGNGVISLYGHQSKVAVSQGDKVKAGQVIGYVGSTGWSTGPHLHFEIRVNDQPVNPLNYFN